MAEIGLFFLVLIWTTKEQLSQGKLGGRRGSSACKSVLIVSDGTAKVFVIDTHFHADTNSGTYFIYGKADEVALYFTKNYPGKTVATLTEVSFVVLVD